MAHSYHCLCNNFILASQHDLFKTTRRGEGAADLAHILPIQDGTASQTLLEGVTIAKEPIIIQREDGLEKRWLASCSRCDLPVGYYLDWLQTAEDVNGKKREGRREDVVYVMPGALTTTEDMKEGKRPAEKELKLKVATV